jgi:hypothetical protein
MAVAFGKARSSSEMLFTNRKYIVIIFVTRGGYERFTIAGCSHSIAGLPQTAGLPQNGEFTQFYAY